jgi:small conductance mechanosensitive channel
MKQEYYYIVMVSTTLIIAFVLSTILRKVINKFIINYSNKLRSDPTHFYFLKNSISVIVYTGAIIYIFKHIPALESISTALFTGGAVLAAVVGFASQKAFSNIISGLFILIFKPFRVQDTIELQAGRKGVVEEITLRHTVIRDYQNRRVIIPNSIISDDTIINSSIGDDRVRNHIEFDISYDSDIDKAMAILVKEAAKHPLTIDGRTQIEIDNHEPLILVRLIGLKDFSVKIRAYVWSENNDTGFVLTCDILKSVKEQFDKEGIEIPFPYRTIVYKNDIDGKKTQANN